MSKINYHKWFESHKNGHKRAERLMPKINTKSQFILNNGFCFAHFLLQFSEQDKINRQRAMALLTDSWIPLLHNTRRMNESNRTKQNQHENKNNFNLEVLFALSTPNDECCGNTQKSHFNHTFPLNCSVALAWNLSFLIWFSHSLQHFSVLRFVECISWRRERREKKLLLRTW